MTTVVGVRFREVGKIYYFDPGELDIKEGDHVIVDTVRGTEYGTVIIGKKEVPDDEIVQPLKVVRRIATKDDDERVRANREKEADAFKICKEKINERGLEMKLISAEYTFDNAKVLFYFTADGRIDFRELVKDLAAIFKIRIELRQVGVRDETKLMGGLGSCGRELCCCSYLSDFVPVSIRMAKEQNLPLNPQKISGMCGRLMCCLKNEADTYEDLNTRLPKQGATVVTEDGRTGVAAEINVLRERVKVLFTDENGNREMEEFPASELKFTPRRKNKPKPEKAVQDEYDEIEEDLLEEELEEENPEIIALEEAELDDIEAEESKDDDGENRVKTKSDARRKHRRRRHHHKVANGQAVNEGQSGDNNRDNNNRKNNDSKGNNNNNNNNNQAAGNAQSENGEGREKHHRRHFPRRRNGNGEKGPKPDRQNTEGHNGEN